LEVDQSITVRLKASRGFQPTSIRLAPNQRYRIIATGAWQIDADGGPIDAGGNSEGGGCLEAVVLEEFRLSDPLQLSKDAILTTTSSGDLFLRCRDAWDQLSDNRGTLVVRLTRDQ
jgi:hypothetical protein